ncbi:transmembrane protein 217 [Ahaetulla prasina]|uniref:transmembrane protein 217 n=1 Tax=Ahaetulla prasina TaxID=499056 RepID=UPI0026491B7D|nr:transmembrane protein 217 [Ahaetulla prasina]XP_058034366.1 transmembrane protein 217 [Ahaetulla prasina]XP_058034367.1 transmembrane protein 217 [Ahaetulla prasina]XP_058034368.1 transmembrane protein 217 [Ahaetulla prasina]
MAIISPDTVIPLFGDGICGITPRAGSVVAGVYMILMTNMYLIFEFRHLSLASIELSKIKVKGLTWIILYCYYTAIVLAFITYPICFYYLYCIYKKKTIGFYVYFSWIIFYDVVNIVIVILTSQIGHLSTFSISPLEWFGLAVRIPVDCFWLCFIITYVMLLVEEKHAGWMSMRQRRTSRYITEPPKFRLGVSVKRVQW